MNLGDILSPAQIIAEMLAANRWEAIDELISNLVQTGKIKPDNRDQIAAVVKKRETSMSTGIGFGIGIPHASTDLIYEVVGAFGRSKKGVNFDALDNQPVKLVMLFLVPQGQFQNISTPSPTSPSCSTKPNFANRSKKRRTPARCIASSRTSPVAPREQPDRARRSPRCQRSGDPNSLLIRDSSIASGTLAGGRSPGFARG
jgi:mannitol/fructose-specific phosphotransferase system IIA component (Ntr-type)